MCSTDERDTEERGAIKKNFISVVKGVCSSSSKEKIQRTRRHKKVHVSNKIPCNM
jgi:hypothetical protein